MPRAPSSTKEVRQSRVQGPARGLGLRGNLTQATLTPLDIPVPNRYMIRFQTGSPPGPMGPLQLPKLGFTGGEPTKDVEDTYH
eukprot:6936668-Pyramimonas_sp.AAC.1